MPSKKSPPTQGESTSLSPWSSSLPCPRLVTIPFPRTLLVLYYTTPEFFKPLELQVLVIVCCCGWLGCVYVYVCVSPWRTNHREPPSHLRCINADCSNDDGLPWRVPTWCANTSPCEQQPFPCHSLVRLLNPCSLGWVTTPHSYVYIPSFAYVKYTHSPEQIRLTTLEYVIPTPATLTVYTSTLTRYLTHVLCLRA